MLRSRTIRILVTVSVIAIVAGTLISKPETAKEFYNKVTDPIEQEVDRLIPDVRQYIS